MPCCLVIGFGNALRSDDAVGFKAAALLEVEISSPTVSVIATHQLTPELAEPIARAARVLFLDARQGGVPGEVRCERIHRDASYQPGNVSHTLSPAALLELAQRYFQAEPEAWLMTVTGNNFEVGDQFSRVIEDCWEAYLNKARTWAKDV